MAKTKQNKLENRVNEIKRQTKKLANVSALYIR